MPKKFLFSFFIFFVSVSSIAYERPDCVPLNVWESLKPYFLPEDMPVKNKLDKIFSVRALKNKKSMEKAGFGYPIPRPWTRMVVVKHPELKGYVLKAYLDSQHYYQKKPEYQHWLKRIQGVELIKREIIARNLQAIFKAPKKWIYPLPPKPSPPNHYLRKNFILVEEDMDILNDKENEKMWKSKPNKEFLTIFFHFLDDLGLWDCARPVNAPYSKDGKIAFIDTQTFNLRPVKFKDLAPYLSKKMRDHWFLLIQSTKKKR